MRHVGLWGGPGILLLLDGVWRYYDPADLEPADLRALREAASACIGNDRPLVEVKRAPDPASPRYDGPLPSPATFSALEPLP